VKKWNKYDTKFILQSLAISCFAIFTWVQFHSYQINENYLDISLNHKEAKEEAIQYLKSRGWDISGYTYAIKFNKIYGNWGYNPSWWFETAGNKDKDQIDVINKLAGHHRWKMRWFKPLQKEEFRISYTKDGALAYFEHFVSDSLAGDTLPQSIAYNLAKMFLKNMPSIGYVENDWKSTVKTIENKPNRLEHYFQWEHTKHTFGDGDYTIRMSIRIRDNKVVRYNRWLEETQEIMYEYQTLGWLSSFFDSLEDSMFFLTAFIAMLFALFYFKVSSNWKLASYIAAFIVSLKIISVALELPTAMFDFDSEDPFWGAATGWILPTITFSSLIGFIIMLFTTALDKLYRKLFPNFISIKHLLNPIAFTSKHFFNNYIIGIRSGLIAIAISSIFYFLVDKSGHYIAYAYLDYNKILSAIPLVYIFVDNIFNAWMLVIGTALINIIIYQLTKIRWLAIVIAAAIASLEPSLFYTDPIYLSIIGLFIIACIGGFIFFRYGILSFAIYAITYFCIHDVILLLFTNQIYNIVTGVIIIVLLLFPAIYSILHYLKYKTTTSADSLLNSAESFPEIATSLPINPVLEHPSNTKWAFALLILGMFCLLIPNNDELQNAWKFTVSRDDAITSAANIIEKKYDGKVSDYNVATAIWDNEIGQGGWGVYYSPFFLSMNKRDHDLGYYKQHVGRKGLLELAEKYNTPFTSWAVRYYKKDHKEYYTLKIHPQNKDNAIMYTHYIPDSTNLPSLSKDAAETLALNNLEQNLSAKNLKFDGYSETIEESRLDHSFSYKKEILFENGFSAIQKFWSGVRGNILGSYNSGIHTPEEWDREYDVFGILMILCTYGTLVLWIITMIISTYYLIYNTIKTKYAISWKLIIGFMLLISFMCITTFVNKLSPVTMGFYNQTSWASFLLEKIADHLSNIPSLLMFMSGSLFALYFINPSIENVFSSDSRNKFGSGALISGLATIGAMLLYRPVKYILYANFPNYMDLSTSSGVSHFSTYIPIYAVLMPIVINTIWVSILSLFFYHKFMDFKQEGKHIKKNLLLFAVILFYLVYGSFVEDPISMIPHFLSRLSGLVLYLTLITYFWKNNPLSHLFGTLIYFQMHHIVNFIQLADSTIKIQGWVVGGLFVLLFIYSVGLESFRKMFSSRTA